VITRFVIRTSKICFDREVPIVYFSGSMFS